MICCLLFIACEQKDLSLAAASEIEAAELAFANRVAEKGIKTAFVEFAAEDAVLMRNDKIISGKQRIYEYYSNSALDSVKLSWTPEKVVAAKSGDLGYTYGKYKFSAVDSSGKPLKAEGIFHTVWKKQTDGSWKFVWD
jgi:ketosteroid isomerase-like protein